MRELMPAWKAALLTFVGLFVCLMVYGCSTGAFGSSNPRNEGRKLGEKAAPILIFAPLVAYVIQKSRLDSARKKP